MSELVEKRHCARLLFVQIVIIACHGICGGLLEESVAYGDYRTLRVCVWLVVWLRRLLALGVIGCANVIDCDCIVFVFAESNELRKKIVVILGGMGFALIFTLDEEFSNGCCLRL